MMIFQPCGDQLENERILLVSFLCFFSLCIHPILQAHGDPSPLFTSPEEYESRKWNHVHHCACPAVTAHGRQRERKVHTSEAGTGQCENRWSVVWGILFRLKNTPNRRVEHQGGPIRQQLEYT